ncbi:MAG: hypothetical protein ACO3JG_13915 [Luteolibacter sp.]
MNHHHSPTQHELLAVELLLTADQRRPRRVSVADHARWNAPGRPPHEDDGDIGELIEEIRRIENEHLSNRKKS